MLRLGFGGCRSFLLLVVCSCRALFLVKHWFRYFGTKLLRHLNTKIHLCIFLLRAKSIQFSTWNGSFEVFLCSTLLRFHPRPHQRSQITVREFYSVKLSNSKTGSVIGETNWDDTRAIEFRSFCKEQVDQCFGMLSNSCAQTNNLRQMEGSSDT